MTDREWFDYIDKQLDQSGKPPYYYPDEALFAALPELVCEKKKCKCETCAAKEEVVNALWERNLRMCYKVVRSYRVREDRISDFRTFAEDTLRDAIKAYKPIAQFGTYFRRIFLKRASTYFATMDSTIEVPKSVTRSINRKNASEKTKTADARRVEKGKRAAAPTIRIDEVDERELVSDWPSPEDICIQRDLDRKREQEIAKLTTLEQSIVKMYREGVPFAKIGKALHLTEKQAARRFHAAAEKIQAKLGKDSI